jgi:hypothetical protein
MENIGKLLIVTGIVIAVVGALLMFSGRISWLGRLPGDIVVQKKNFTIYFPVVTCILISIVFTIIYWPAGRK